MTKAFLIFVIFFALIDFNLIAQTSSEWRGVGRTGIYNETGLLKVWPENGPEMIWYADSLPDGFSSISISEESIYLTGIIDSSDVLVSLNINGKELWRTCYGRAWNESFPSSRCTPTIDNNKIYVSSGRGDLACIDAQNGKILWARKASEEFGGTMGRWGIAESPVVDEKKVYFTTGGNNTNTIAINKNSGELVWQSKSLNDNASYTSPLMVNYKNKRLLVIVTQKFIVGIKPENGEIYWKFDFGSYAGGEGKRNNNTNTPVFSDGGLFIASGYDHAGVKLQLAEDLKSVSFLWKDTIMDTHHGGVVKIGDYLYGSNWQHNSMGKWACLNWITGKLQYETEWINKGSIISAENMLYCTEEKTGNIALVSANPNEFKVISSFKIPKGLGPYWAHPVINKGVLYIRHGRALMAYNIRQI